MGPSRTVENYLKSIYQAQLSLDTGETLVPMGQLAAALGVVPGTATTMVKALAESGLAHYEPYAGVRLTTAGKKLAALVLRRHRLIELFLVQVMGMSWTDVHDEAEHLEHAVSDRLIDRIDEMLGRPVVDPHGDPIPDAHGALPNASYDTLLTSPVGSPVTIARVADQDRAFLEFVALHRLRPGDVVQIEERSAEGDSVQLRAGGNQRVTLGARAASKLLVAARTLAVVLFTCRAVLAQTPAVNSEPFRITDNSFLVEEAFNQEPGIFQNIFGASRIGGAWTATFTQEWPVVTAAHQLSYTLAFTSPAEGAGLGDALVNYRYQVLEEGPGRPAFAPRVSAVLPSGDSNTGRGNGSYGVQFNLPFSKQAGNWYWHWNAGLTWLARAKATFERDNVLLAERHSLTSPFLAASAIARIRPMLHVMMESVLSFDQQLGESGVVRSTAFTLSPGVRGGWNLGDKQIVVGMAVPISWADETHAGAFLYLSYELPFRRVN
jgi:DtxR family Mn-dependent transcriptional regulator